MAVSSRGCILDLRAASQSAASIGPDVALESWPSEVQPCSPHLATCLVKELVDGEKECLEQSLNEWWVYLQLLVEMM
jgi:hypothetical protein